MKKDGTLITCQIQAKDNQFFRTDQGVEYTGLSGGKEKKMEKILR